MTLASRFSPPALALAALLLGPAASALAQQPQPPAAPTAPVCIYDNRSYSEGAYLCAQKALLLTCRVEDGKATWSIVADKDLAGRCPAKAARAASAARSHIHRRRLGRTYVYPPGGSVKCLVIEGRRYCE